MALVIAVTICVANIIVLNIFAMIMSMALCVAICFALGYKYCKYEISKEEQSAEPNGSAVTNTVGISEEI